MPGSQATNVGGETGQKKAGSLNSEGGSGSGGEESRGNRNRCNKGQRGSGGGRFKGKCEELGGAVYDIGAPTSSQDLYNTTMKEIAEYAARKYDDAGEFCLGLVDLKLPRLDAPKPPGTDAGVAEVEIYKMDLKEHRV